MWAEATSTHASALHICIGSPKEDFAQIYTKVQPWEVKQNIPNGSGRNEPFKNYNLWGNYSTDNIWRQ